MSPNKLSIKVILRVEYVDYKTPKELTSLSASFLGVEIQGTMKVKVKLLSHVRLFATPWTIAHQVPLPMGFFRQEYGSGLPFPSPGDLPDPGIEPKTPVSPALQVDFFYLLSHWGSSKLSTAEEQII